MTLTITVHGTPAPQGSKRAFRNQHSGRIQQVESSKRVAPWRSDVRDAAFHAVDRLDQHTAALLWEAPLAVRIEFRLPRPKGHWLPANSRRPEPELHPYAPAHPAGKPDLDKLTRAVLDALTGIVWRDDSQVVHIEAWKHYDGRPGADITVTEATT